MGTEYSHPEMTSIVLFLHSPVRLAPSRGSTDAPAVGVIALSVGQWWVCGPGRVATMGTDLEQAKPHAEASWGPVGAPPSH